MQVKLEEEVINAQYVEVLKKHEPEDEMNLIKDEGIFSDSDSSSDSFNPTVAPFESDPDTALFNYLKCVGASQNLDEGTNIIHNGKIYNPTPEVKMFNYYDEHCFKERYIDCGVNRQNNHRCRFYRIDDPQHAIGFRYLNCNGSVYYKNPDHSEYYIDPKVEWYIPPPPPDFKYEI